MDSPRIPSAAGVSPPRCFSDPPFTPTGDHAVERTMPTVRYVSVEGPVSRMVPGTDEMLREIGPEAAPRPRSAQRSASSG